MYTVTFSEHTSGYYGRYYKCSPKFDSLVDAVRYLAEDLRNDIVHKIHSVTCGSREIDLRKFRLCVMIEACK